VVFLSDLSALNSAPFNCYGYNDWIPYWNQFFKGKTVTFLIVKALDEVVVKEICAGLNKIGATVFVGRYTGSSDDLAATHIYIDKSSNETVCQGDDLSELIESFHYVTDKNNRQVYRAALPVPARVVVEAAVKWFLERGARFLWDTDDNRGYMMFEGRTYNLCPGDPNLKSLLFDKGKITSNGEGRNIMEGLCSLEAISSRVSPAPWVKSNTLRQMITIAQANETIVVAPGSVTTRVPDELVYSMIEPTWFQPVYYDPDVDPAEAMQLLYNTTSRHFATSQDGKEIITCWFLASLLQGWSSIRPGLRIRGDASTGKSTILKMMYWIFYGDRDPCLPTFGTNVGLWRKGTVEPLIMIDNENVKDAKESLKQFLDLASTGGKRITGTQGASIQTKFTRVHTLVAISGLDSFFAPDVLTRYYEIETDFKYQGTYYELEDSNMIFDNRNTILSGWLKMIANDVFPSLHKYANRGMVEKIRPLLRTKWRTTDYYVVMLCIYEVLHKYGVFQRSVEEVTKTWANYISNLAVKSAAGNSDTIEAFLSFKMAYENFREDFISMRNDLSITSSHPFEVILSPDKDLIGVEGTREDLFYAVNWACSVLKRRCPWTNGRDMMAALYSDREVLDSINWTHTCVKDRHVVKWE
jgi:hypothetical protein